MCGTHAALASIAWRRYPLPGLDTNARRLISAFQQGHGHGLVRRANGHNGDEFRPYAAIVQKRIAFGRRPIGADRFAFIMRLDQEAERLAFDLDDIFSKSGIACRVE